MTGDNHGLEPDQLEGLYSAIASFPVICYLKEQAFKHNAVINFFAGFAVDHFSAARSLYRTKEKAMMSGYSAVVELAFDSAQSIAVSPESLASESASQ